MVKFKYIVLCALFISVQCFAYDIEYAKRSLTLIQEDGSPILKARDLTQRDRYFRAIRACFSNEFLLSMTNSISDEEYAHLLETIVWKESYYCYIDIMH